MGWFNHQLANFLLWKVWTFYITLTWILISSVAFARESQATTMVTFKRKGGTRHKELRYDHLGGLDVRNFLKLIFA